MNTPPATPPGHRSNGRNRRRRWIPWAGAAVLVLLIALGLRPQPTPVETVTVTRGALRASVDEEGKTRIRHRYVVSAPVAGQLRRIPFKAGAELSSTQTVVAVIDPMPAALLDARARSLAEARRDTAMAQLERARAAQKFAASELRRSETLRLAGTLSVQDLEQAQWKETAAARELSAAESALREAEAGLAEFASPGPGARPPIELHAPVSGKVLRVFEESSRVVLSGTPLMEVGDPADLEVIVEVLSRDGASIQPGTPVELEQWGGGEPLQATVRFVEPAAFTKVSALGVEEQRVNVVADLLTPAGQRGNLGDNFRVEARIITWQTTNAIKVPAGALFRRGSTWHVFALDGAQARLREVRTGRTSGIETEILEGLKEGDEVVLYPGDRIREGTRVRRVRI